MSNDNLPTFRPTSIEYARSCAERFFYEVNVIAVAALPENAFRAWFRREYFVLAEGATEPSKSQWNTLKKRIKRIHPGVFIFKAHGEAVQEDVPSYFLDFGFFVD